MFSLLSFCYYYFIVFHVTILLHDDVIKWKHFPRNWPFVRGIHRSPVNSPHKGQWRGALMFTLICARINGWVNTREAGDLRRYRPHYDVIVMCVSMHQTYEFVLTLFVLTKYLLSLLLWGVRNIWCITEVISRLKNVILTNLPVKIFHDYTRSLNRASHIF